MISQFGITLGEMISPIIRDCSLLFGYVAASLSQGGLHPQGWALKDVLNAIKIAVPTIFKTEPRQPL